MQLVMRPEQFDVLVLENLYGDIVSDLCAGLIGGLGLAPGANIGELGAVFEAVHGSAPDIAGQGIANPTALMLSAVQMLNHIGENEAAKRMHDAMLAVFAEGKWITRDLGGTAKTNEFARAIEEKIKTGASAAASITGVIYDASDHRRRGGRAFLCDHCWQSRPPRRRP